MRKTDLATASAQESSKTASREEPSPPGQWDLPQTFWEDFANNYWEKRPLLIRQAFARPILTPDATFKSLVEASERYRSNPETVPLSFYIEYAQVVAEVGKHLPKAEDATTTAYARRVGEKIGGQRFGLVVQELQAGNPLLWLRLREFILGLRRVVGGLGQGAKATAFFGDYAKTPVGLHDGDSSNFKFVIEGRKKMHLWPDEFFRGKDGVRRTLDYEQFLEDGITLEGDPGDVIYWPSSHWHIGEPVGGLALSISLALFVHDQPLAAGEAWNQIVHKIGTGIAATDLDEHDLFDAKKLPKGSAVMAAVSKSVTASLSGLAKEKDLASELDLLWLNRATSGGFDSVPPPRRARALQEDDVVQGEVHFPIACSPVEDDDLVCSANGHSFATAANPNVVKLIETLNAGGSHRVGALLDAFAGSIVADDVEYEASREDIRALLEKFYTLRALVVSDAGAEE